MKTIKKLQFLTILSGAFLINSSLNGLSAQIITNPGIYKTYDDFSKHHLTKYDKIDIGQHGCKGVLNGKKVSSVSYKDADFWGMQNESGVIYRINKKANIADQVISNGKICFYAGPELIIKRNDDGSLNSMDIKADAGSKFSEVFWLSSGGEGEMIGASEDNLSTLMADSPDLVAKLKDKPIDETKTKTWIDSYTMIADLIGKYDKAHK
jgi:hypothetical protein